MLVGEKVIGEVRREVKREKEREIKNFLIIQVLNLNYFYLRCLTSSTRASYSSLILRIL